MMLALIFASLIPAFLFVALVAPIQMPTLAGLITLSLVAGLPQVWWSSVKMMSHALPLFIALLWAGASTLWSVDSDSSLSKAGQLAALLIGGLFAVTCIQMAPLFERRHMPAAAVFGFSAIVSIVVFLILSSGGIVEAMLFDGRNVLDRFNRFAAALAVIAFPVLFLIPQLHFSSATTRVLLLASGLLILLILVKLNMSAAPLAFIVGGCVFVLTCVRSILGAIALLFILIGITVGPIVIVTTDFMPLESLPNSFLHRIAIWEFVLEKVVEQPFLGWGLNAARDIPGGQEIVSSNALNGVIGSLPQWEFMQTLNPQKLPLHPHNGPLQIILELGLIGFSVVVLLFLRLVLSIHRSGLTQEAKATCYSTIGAALMIGGLSFGVWQSWWIATLILAAMICALVTRPRVRSPLPLKVSLT